MWLSNSSVGRKFIMALTGAFLVLFITFHCLMNAVAIFWPSAYNAVCEFLGANWYALVGTAVIAVFVLLHIIYAVMLTMQNRTARGSQRYAISHRPASVEWSSQNMFVLGIVILAFLVVHLIQFWAKMQLAEVMGEENFIPAAAGTLFLQEAFSVTGAWTLIVYMIGFVALWFHLTHGFWSMFQSVGWDNTTWLPRLKCISNWWVSIVVVLFMAEGVVFTIQADRDYYLTDETLREQYIGMLADKFEAVDPGMAENIRHADFQQLQMGLPQVASQIEMQKQQMQSPEAKQMIQAQIQANPEMKGEIESQMKKMDVMAEYMSNAVKFIEYLDPASKNKPQTNMAAPAAAPY